MRHWLILLTFSICTLLTGVGVGWLLQGEGREAFIAFLGLVGWVLIFIKVLIVESTNAKRQTGAKPLPVESLFCAHCGGEHTHWDCPELN